MANVFVSHAGEDTAAALEVRAWLRADGHAVFLDRDIADGIKIGDDWSQRLLDQLRSSDAVVCLLSAAYARSTWCTAEVAIATSHGSKLLPLTLEEGADHTFVAHLQHFALWSQPERARAAVAAVLRDIDGTGGRAWPDDRSPFPGLEPFTAREQHAFFGRDADIRKLVDGVRSAAQASASVTLIVGPSGCGKSSLVMAGLVPAVSDDADWRALAPFRPGTDPLSALVGEFVRAGRLAGLPWTASDVRRRLRDGLLADLATDLLAEDDGTSRRLLVVVDQFEELVNRTDPAGRRQFVDALLARTAGGGAVRVVGTLRSEFLDVVQADPAFADVSMAIEPVAPLRRAALPSVVERPARLAGITIEDGLVGRIVEDTGSGDALPLLAYTLEALAKGVRRGGTLTHAHYDALEGVQGALVKQAGAALADAVARLGRSEREVLRTLLGLVAVDGRGRPTRLRVPVADLPRDALAELGPFVERRIMVTSEDGVEPTIGVAHEAVLTEWPPLAAAIQEERAALRGRDAVVEAARQWAQDSKRDGRLWERGQVANARRDLGMPSWGPVRSDRVALPDQAVEFLRRSARRNRFRSTRLGVAVAVLLVVALVGTVFAVVMSRAADDQSKITLAHQLVAEAETARGGDDRTALQLGIAAQRLRPDARTAASLIETASATHYARTLPVPRGATVVAFAHGGLLMATGSVTGQVQLWDMTNPRQPTAIGAPLDRQIGIIYSVEFSPDGRTLAAAGGTTGPDGTGGSGKAVLWDVTLPAAPRPLPELTGHAGVVHAATFAPVGGTLATAGFDGQVLLWNVANPGTPSRIGGPLTAHQGRVTTVAFSPDGTRLATGGFDHRVLLWNVADHRAPAVLLGAAPDGPTNAVWRLAWSGTTLAAASADGTVRLWDARPDALGARPSISVGRGQAYTVAFSPDGTRLVTGGTARAAGLWDITDRAQPQRIEVLGGHAGAVYTAAFRDATTVVSGSADGTAVVWDLAPRLAATPLGPPSGTDAEVYAATTARDGRVLVTGTADGRLALTDLATGQQDAKVDAGPGAVRTLAVTPDGRALAVGGDAGIELWDITGPLPQRLPDLGDPRRRIYSLAVSDDGRTLAAGGDNTIVELWDIADPRRPSPRPPLPGHTGAVYAVRFSGTRLAAGGADNAIIVWDIGDPDRPTPVGPPLTGHAGPVNTIAFSPDGTTMATGSDDGAVLLWTVDAAGQARPFGRQPAASPSAVLTAAFAPDGRTIAAGYGDGRVALWDLTEPGYPRPLGPDLTGSSAVNALAFPNAATLVAAARVTTVRRWDLAPWTALQADPATQACAVVGTGLDDAQWVAHLGDEPYSSTCTTS